MVFGWIRPGPVTHESCVLWAGEMYELIHILWELLGQPNIMNLFLVESFKEKMDIVSTFRGKRASCATTIRTLWYICKMELKVNHCKNPQHECLCTFSKKLSSVGITFVVTDYPDPHLWCKAKQGTCRTAKGVYIASLLLLFTFRGSYHEWMTHQLLCTLCWTCWFLDAVTFCLLPMLASYFSQPSTFCCSMALVCSSSCCFLL